MNQLNKTVEERLWELESERIIRDMLFRYCDGADRREWDRVRSVFHADAIHRHDRLYEGPSSAFIDGGEQMMPKDMETHHHVANVVVEINGKTARTQCSIVAHHLIPADAPTTMYRGHTPGVAEDYWVGARYFDTFAYRDGRWGIVLHEVIHDWERWEKADARGFSRDLKCQAPSLK